MINGLWLWTIIYAMVIVLSLIVTGIIGCIAIVKEMEDEE